MRRSSRLVAAGAAVLAFGACGGYQGLTKAQFVSQADALCKTYDAKFSALFGHVSASPTLSEVKGIYRDQAIPVFLEEVEQLRKLKPPKADRATVAKIFDDLSAGVDQLDIDVKASTSLKALEGLAPSGLTEASADAKAYGLTECGSS